MTPQAKTMSQRRAGAILGYANIVVKNLVNLIYTPMLLSFVGQADYGVYQTCNSFVFSLSLLSFGFAGAYVRFFTQRRVKGDEAGIRVLNGMYLLLYLAVCAVALVIGLLLSSNVGLLFSGNFTVEEVGLMGSLMVILTFNIVCTLFSSVFDSYVVAHEQFRFQQSRQMLAAVATPGMAFLLLEFGMGAVGVATAQLAVNVLLLLLNARFAIVRLGMRFDLRHPDLMLFRAVAVFSAWLFANQICDIVNQNVPNMLLGMTTSSTVVAVFAVAVQVRNVFVSLSTALSNVFVPKVNAIVAESDDNSVLTRFMTRVGRYQMVLFCWVYGGFLFLGDFFVRRWAGEGFSDAYWLVVVMVLPLGIPLAQNVGIEIQKAKNMHRARSLVYLAMAVGNVAFTYLASPSLGYWAPAIAYVASIALGNGVWMNWYYHYRVGLDMGIFWRKNLSVLLCSAAVASVFLTVTHFLPVTNWMGFLLWGVAYTVIFALAVYVSVLDVNEKASIRRRLERRTDA